MKSIDLEWVQANVNPRQINGHKKTFGHVFVIAGSKGKAGAAILCARAALHSGCGLVTAMVPDEAVASLLAESPELMYLTDKKIDEIDLSAFDCIAIGPGMGLTPESKNILYYVLENYKGPVVIDADALTLISSNLQLLNLKHIVTPHPGEFARLQGKEYDPLKREAQAVAFVKNNQVNLVLKGALTIVVASNEPLMINTTGNDGMATAGSGDVLTGLIASLCAQGYAPYQAACIGVYLHGLAGDIAIQTQSKASLVASDLIKHLGEIRLLD
jgi:NAD(P)H-hydrate epimerase